MMMESNSSIHSSSSSSSSSESSTFIDDNDDNMFLMVNKEEERKEDEDEKLENVVEEAATQNDPQNASSSMVTAATTTTTTTTMENDVKKKQDNTSINDDENEIGRSLPTDYASLFYHSVRRPIIARMTANTTTKAQAKEQEAEAPTKKPPSTEEEEQEEEENNNQSILSKEGGGGEEEEEEERNDNDDGSDSIIMKEHRPSSFTVNEEGPLPVTAPPVVLPPPLECSPIPAKKTDTTKHLISPLAPETLTAEDHKPFATAAAAATAADPNFQPPHQSPAEKEASTTDLLLPSHSLPASSSSSLSSRRIGGGARRRQSDLLEPPTTVFTVALNNNNNNNNNNLDDDDDDASTVASQTIIPSVNTSPRGESPLTSTEEEEVTLGGAESLLSLKVDEVVASVPEEVLKDIMDLEEMTSLKNPCGGHGGGGDDSSRRHTNSNAPIVSEEDPVVLHVPREKLTKFLVETNPPAGSTGKSSGRGLQTTISSSAATPICDTTSKTQPLPSTQYKEVDHTKKEDDDEKPGDLDPNAFVAVGEALLQTTPPKHHRRSSRFGLLAKGFLPVVILALLLLLMIAGARFGKRFSWTGLPVQPGIDNNGATHVESWRGDDPDGGGVASDLAGPEDTSFTSTTSVDHAINLGEETNHDNVDDDGTNPNPYDDNNNNNEEEDSISINDNSPTSSDEAEPDSNSTSLPFRITAQDNYPWTQESSSQVLNVVETTTTTTAEEACQPDEFQPDVLRESYRVGLLDFLGSLPTFCQLLSVLFAVAFPSLLIAVLSVIFCTKRGQQKIPQQQREDLNQEGQAELVVPLRELVPPVGAKNSKANNTAKPAADKSLEKTEKGDSRVSITDQIDLENYTYLRKPDLKLHLRARGLPVSGNKDVLIKRLVEDYHEELIELSYKQLQSKLKAADLKATGKKNEMILRLLEAGF